MIKGISLGQYRHKESVIHFLDARIKISYVILLSIISFSIKSSFYIAVFTSFILLILLLAKIDLKSFAKNLRPFYLIFVFILLMYILFSPNQIKLGLIAVWRFFILISISMLLTFTTKLSDIVGAIEKLSRPLKIFKIKPRNIAVMISIAIRFIPVMFINFERAREAMLSRLANFRKLKHIKLLILVVLERMLKSASNLSDAMHSRLYNENVESKRIMKLGEYDYLSMIAMALLLLFIY